jgi:hypothetical protein
VVGGIQQLEGNNVPFKFHADRAKDIWKMSGDVFKLKLGLKYCTWTKTNLKLEPRAFFATSFLHNTLFLHGGCSNTKEPFGRPPNPFKADLLTLYSSSNDHKEIVGIYEAWYEKGYIRWNDDCDWIPGRNYAIELSDAFDQKRLFSLEKYNEKEWRIPDNISGDLTCKVFPYNPGSRAGFFKKLRFHHPRSQTFSKPLSQGAFTDQSTSALSKGIISSSLFQESAPEGVRVLLDEDNLIVVVVWKGAANTDYIVEYQLPHSTDWTHLDSVKGTSCSRPISFFSKSIALLDNKLESPESHKFKFRVCRMGPEKQFSQPVTFEIPVEMAPSDKYKESHFKVNKDAFENMEIMEEGESVLPVAKEVKKKGRKPGSTPKKAATKSIVKKELPSADVQMMDVESAEESGQIIEPELENYQLARAPALENLAQSPSVSKSIDDMNSMDLEKQGENNKVLRSKDLDALFDTHSNLSMPCEQESPEFNDKTGEMLFHDSSSGIPFAESPNLFVDETLNDVEMSFETEVTLPLETSIDLENDDSHNDIDPLVEYKKVIDDAEPQSPSMANKTKKGRVAKKKKEEIVESNPQRGRKSLKKTSPKLNKSPKSTT